jgi:hypothetical protein
MNTFVRTSTINYLLNTSFTLYSGLDYSRSIESVSCDFTYFFYLLNDPHPSFSLTSIPHLNHDAKQNSNQIELWRLTGNQPDWFFTADLTTLVTRHMLDSRWNSVCSWLLEVLFCAVFSVFLSVFVRKRKSDEINLPRLWERLLEEHFWKH